MFQQILTERLVLRSLRPDDSENMLAYRSHPDVVQYQSWRPQTLKEIQSFIGSMATKEFSTPGWYQIGITLGSDGALIGDCGIHFLETDSRIVEIGITIAPLFQCKGYAKEVLRAILNLLFVSLNKHRVIASVDPRNQPSMALMQRMGLRKEGHFIQSIWFKESWVDDIVFAILASEWHSHQHHLISNKHTANDRDNTLRRIRDVIQRLMQEGVATAHLDNSVHNLFPIAISSAEGESLRSWINREHAMQTIEIGLAYGMSTLHICQGLIINGDETAHHVAIDPFQTTGFKNCGLQFLAEAGVSSMVEHHAELSQIVLPKFLCEGRRFDFAFVDGNHNFDAIFVDLFYLGRLVRAGGIIFADDYQLPGVARAVSFCLKNLGWTLEELSPSHDEHQWAVLRTPIEPVQRSFRHLVEF